jgi:hypothetical protein
MMRIATRLLLISGAGAVLGLLHVAPANATTCSSACNGIRRACIHVAQATAKAAYTVCDDDRDACRAECEVSNQPCIDFCATQPDLVTCEAGCDCNTACNEFRVGCRDAAKTLRTDARALCTASRESCNTTCVDPIDGECVRDCKGPLRKCRGDASRAAVSCKKNCANGTAKRACVRGCKRLLNEGLKLCSGQEALCIGGCIGVGP